MTARFASETRAAATSVASNASTLPPVLDQLGTARHGGAATRRSAQEPRSSWTGHRTTSGDSTLGVPTRGGRNSPAAPAAVCACSTTDRRCSMDNPATQGHARPNPLRSCTGAAARAAVGSFRQRAWTSTPPRETASGPGLTEQVGQPPLHRAAFSRLTSRRRLPTRRSSSRTCRRTSRSARRRARCVVSAPARPGRRARRREAVSIGVRSRPDPERADSRLAYSGRDLSGGRGGT